MAHTDGTASLPARAATLLGIETREFPAVAWSFVYFFCLLSAYYMLRSVRESMAIAGGIDNIPWLFTGTFVATMLATPVFGWVASRYARRQFLPWVYYFFIANILLFFAGFTWVESREISGVWIGRTFFVWLSVFNLFVVSVFWSFMADIYSKEQSRRLFGIISAGGSTGAILGPWLTSQIVETITFRNLLPLSALLLAFGVVCVYQLRQWATQRHDDSSATGFDSAKPIGGRALDGIRLVLRSRYLGAIAGALVIANFLGGAVYIFMAQLVEQSFATTDEQTKVFAYMDAASNSIAFLGQFLLVRYAVRGLGVGTTLAILPLISILGFALLALHPVFAVMAVLQVLRRGIGFGFTKPTTDMLYSVVSPEARYKAKNFVETAIYRGGDVFASWSIRGLSVMGISAVALICAGLAVGWIVLALRIGWGYQRRDEATSTGETA